MNETVNYTYDPLNRLLTAQATNNAWGNSYTYDSFGNLTAMNVTAGSAPHFSINSDPATNRSLGTLAPIVYDANGNPIGTQPAGSNPYINQAYDVENRLTWTTGTGAYTYIGYDPSGKRVTQIDMVNGSQFQNERIHFYSITGQRLGTYTLSSSGTYFSATSLNLYFGGKLMRSAGVTVATDRLGSVRGNSSGERMAYWPYGQERTGTPDGREKFGTYFRDVHGSDYADQRYYDYGAGRFHTPDRGSSVNLRTPTSWNKYIYGSDDPVNRYDPSGLDDCPPGAAPGATCVTVSGSGDLIDLDPVIFWPVDPYGGMLGGYFTASQVEGAAGQAFAQAAAASAALSNAQAALNKVTGALSDAAATQNIFSAEQLDCISGIETGRTWNPSIVASNGREGLFQFNQDSWAYSGTSIPWDGGSNAQDPYTSAMVALALLTRNLGYGGVQNPTAAAVQSAIDKFGENDGRYGQAVVDCAKELQAGDFDNAYNTLQSYANWIAQGRP
jgi:RHS repeat-associated protein